MVVLACSDRVGNRPVCAALPDDGAMLTDKRAFSVHDAWPTGRVIKKLSQDKIDAKRQYNSERYARAKVYANANGISVAKALKVLARGT